ncbi:MAG TPA: cation:proton antiporter [Lacibacter sp.]|nr:cation:proton antiporter [Lacibacter sp.]HMO88617.1 cation:proton antiporter [Lacibacter sp.]
MEPYIIDGIWLTIAFLSGLLAKRAGLPALIGFLLTGLVLNALGVQAGNINEVLHTLSDLGIMLLLFTIGLKIKFQSLLKREVWFTASAHMLLSVLALGGFVLLLSVAGLSYFTDLTFTSSLLIGFSLSFSSTVFVAKILEERGELSSFHGKIAIGILVIQDIFAVIFLALSSSKTPSLLALTLPLYLYLIRFVLYRVLDASGHGELLTAFGFVAAFVTGAMAFYITGVKADLGALVMGMLLVNHPKADELYDRMMSYKDFFLIAFFVSIGLTGVPTWGTVGVALILLPFMFVKGSLFMLLFSRFNLRARTAFLTSLSLSNFSEFGLITSMIGMKMGILPADWILIIALLMSITFFVSSPLNARVHRIFDRNKRLIMRLNTGKKYIDTEPTDLGDANYLVIGMGSIGRPAYAHFNNLYPGKVIGIDYKHEAVEAMKATGCNVVWGDATNSVFWHYAKTAKIKLILLAMSDFNSNKNTLLEIMKLKRKKFKIAVITHYPDEIEYFRKQGVDYIYDYKSNIGADFAEQTVHSLAV